MTIHVIKTISDILELEPEQIERILPELTAWAFTVKLVKKDCPDAKIDTFVWDDGNE